MAKKIIGNLEVTNNITSENKNVVRSVNSSLADSSGNVNIDMTSMKTTGQYGDTFITNENGTIISDTIVKYARLTTDDEFQNEKNTIVSWNTIFNTWYRFSHGGNGLFPSSTSEVNSWSYNSTNNQIYSTINSATYIGLVSPERYDNYNLEVNVSSTDNDDDYIGLVLAFVSIDGVEYTLSALRGCGGQNASNLWALWYNYGQPSQIKLAGDNKFNWTTGPSKGWNTFPDGCNIKSIRDGNTITCNTTDFAAPNNYISELKIDLTSRPELAKFINPAKVGYSAMSQAKATFKTLSFSGGNVILNIDTDQVWEYNFTTSQWELDTTATVYDQIKPGYIYVNMYSRVAYTLFDTKDIRVVAGHSVGNISVNQIPSMKYFESVLSNTGYQKYPSGMCESWGTITNVTSSNTATSTLPVSYSEIYNVQCTIVYKSGNTSTGIVFGTANASNNTVTVGTTSSAACDIYYRVIGKA